MLELEAEAMLIGNWKSIIELEENLTLQELEVIINTARKMQEREQRFFAALQGVDLSADDEAEAKLEAVKARAKARLEGRSVESVEFEDLGIVVETGD